MKHSILSILLFLVISSFCFPQAGVKHKVSVTIDDLPLGGMDSHKQDVYENIFNKLISEIKKQNTPVTGFVNGVKLNTNGTTDKNKLKLVENWIDAGLDLGNHTYSHKSANKVPVAEYEEDIINGEKNLKELLSAKGKVIKYFRHPFLHTGLSLDIKYEIDNFLKTHGYTIAPVTIDNSEWIFAKAYDDAFNNKDNVMLKKIGDEYIAYMKSKFEYYEGRSNVLFGRNISHILLIHSNRLNSEYYSALCEMLRKMNYDFVSLDEALKDGAYKTEDKFIGKGGISWMDRWALTMGKKKDFFAGEPPCPKYIMKYANIEGE
jgi:peptidoglycan/xylan/chitin deacetylase (PgdA/CDA1 family)